LEIGAQIEMPFAYDQSDLDLDKYVMKIAHQLAEVTAVSVQATGDNNSQALTMVHIWGCMWLWLWQRLWPWPWLWQRLWLWLWL
jgi:hypothetical protein